MNFVWIYNSYTGSVGQVPSLMADALLAAAGKVPGADWHGPFATKQDALNFYTANAAANPNWKAPTGVAGNIANIPVSQAQAVLGGATSGIEGQIAQFIAPVAEIALGLVLLAIAANAILKQTTGVDVARSTGRAAKKTAKTAANVAAVA